MHILHLSFFWLLSYPLYSRQINFTIKVCKYNLFVTTIEFNSLESWKHLFNIHINHRIVSRLPAYQLFFKEISEICENAQQSEDAFLFDSCRRISFEINKVADVLMDVAENIENFDDDVTELGDLLYHEELQYRKYKIRTSTFSTLAFRRTMSREPTYPCYIFLFSKYLMICRLR